MRNEFLFERNTRDVGANKYMVVSFHALAGRAVRTVVRVALVHHFSTWKNLVDKLDKEVENAWMRAAHHYD